MTNVSKVEKEGLRYILCENDTAGVVLFTHLNLVVVVHTVARIDREPQVLLIKETNGGKHCTDELMRVLGKLSLKDADSKYFGHPEIIEKRHVKYHKKYSAMHDIIDIALTIMEDIVTIAHEVKVKEQISKIYKVGANKNVVAILIGTAVYVLAIDNGRKEKIFLLDYAKHKSIDEALTKFTCVTEDLENGSAMYTSRSFKSAGALMDLMLRNSPDDIERLLGIVDEIDKEKE